MESGARFGPYVLEALIAQGGMAEVFRARRVGAAGFSRAVCIKLIRPSMDHDGDFREMFIDEARTGAQLRHRNIVSIEDFGETEGRLFLCMELVVGTEIALLHKGILARGERFPIDAAVHTVAEVLRALAYAHRQTDENGLPLGLVHRDVSPQNVLATADGDVKLTDFGIARASTRQHKTQGNVVKGKLVYMAPEQARGQELDGRTDLFSAGVVLYELLAGRLPFATVDGAERDKDSLHHMLRGVRRPLAELRADVPDGVARVVDTLLAHDRNARPATADDALALVVALPEALHGARTLAALVARHMAANAFAREGTPDTAINVFTPEFPHPIDGPTLPADARAQPATPYAIATAAARPGLRAAERPATDDTANAANDEVTTSVIAPAPPPPPRASLPDAGTWTAIAPAGGTPVSGRVAAVVPRGSIPEARDSSRAVRALRAARVPPFVAVIALAVALAIGGVVAWAVTAPR